MDSKIILLTLLFLASCISPAAQIQPALDTAQQLASAFDREQAVNRALVERSNPQPATLQAFIAAQAETRTVFMAVYQAHAAHIASLGGLSPEATQALLDQIAKTIIVIGSEPR